MYEVFVVLMIKSSNLNTEELVTLPNYFHLSLQID
jgi:hypothetical protein